MAKIDLSKILFWLFDFFNLLDLERNISLEISFNFNNWFGSIEKAESGVSFLSLRLKCFSITTMSKESGNWRIDIVSVVR